MKSIYILLLLMLFACNQENNSNKNQSSTVKDTFQLKPSDSNITQTSIVVLGNVQDGGSPHAGCRKDCCRDLFLHPDVNRQVVALGITDPVNKMNFLFEATPDLPRQMKYLKEHSPFSVKETPDAIFLTHAHIGHYTGLMYLGKEAMNSNKVPVYAMPRMKTFLENNGPWSQLVSLHNIILQPLENRQYIQIGQSIKIAPISVPHRDEYSETIGYMIITGSKYALFIPDIDKWEKWDSDITEMIQAVDYAFIDGTFYDATEVGNRNISEIPHPFITESMEKFKNLSTKDKAKIYFIHFNHTNPVLDPESKASKDILSRGFHIARYGMRFPM